MIVSIYYLFTSEGENTASTGNTSNTTAGEEDTGRRKKHLQSNVREYC